MKIYIKKTGKATFSRGGFFEIIVHPVQLIHLDYLQNH